MTPYVAMALAASALLILSARSSLCGEDWVAPASATTVANAAASDPKAPTEGGAIYATYCASCHGAGGKGDGVSGMYLSPKPTNFTDPRLWNESDGGLFWKLTTGRKAMPSYKATLSESQRWKVIVYLRSLAPKPATPAPAAPQTEHEPKEKER